MAITFDPAKRDKTLRERSLDFASAALVFSGPRATFEDNRFDYGETRLLTVGFLDGRMVIVCWTPRGEDRHIISITAEEYEEIPELTDELTSSPP